MSYVNIAQQLVIILQSISDLAAVYNHEPKELKDYPCATVSAASHKDAFSDTAANRRIYIFTVRLYFRTDVAQDAETVLRGLADSVIGMIESNVTLNGVCDFAKPTEGTWDYQEREVPVRVCILTIECNKRINR